MVMLPSTSASFNDTQNSSILNLSNVEQKKQYHKIIDELSQLDKESVDNAQRVDSTRKVVDATRSLGSAAANTSTVLLDSYVLRQAGRQALAAVTSIQVNTNAYNALELAGHILENPAWWQFPLPRRVPSAATMHGAFEPTPPPARERAPRRRADPQRSAAPRKPDNIASLEKREEDTAMMRAVRRWVAAASARGPLSLWHAVLHPASFAATVLNVYYVSFLVRHGQLEIYVDEALGIPMLRPSEFGSEKDISKMQQFVVSIDMQRWQSLVEACGITEPMMTFGNVP